MESWLERFAESGFLRSADVAHDLKTPLNVAVLNLELARMRMTKVGGGEIDEKTATYLRGIETELRRMARIFDAFFVHSVPPRDSSVPAPVDCALLFREAFVEAGVEAAELKSVALLPAHEARFREAARMCVEGMLKNIDPASMVLAEEQVEGKYRLVVSGTTKLGESELGKLFKFYYTDASGTPDLAMATARLILETYGGTVEAQDRGGSVSFEVIIPVGEQ